MKKRSTAGLIFTLIVALVAVITAIVYMTIYNGTNYMSWVAFWLLIGGAVVSTLLLFVKLEKFSPAIQFATVVLALCMYIYFIYFFISSAIYGIQYSGLPPAFFVNAGFYALTLILAFVNIFLPHDAKKAEKK